MIFMASAMCRHSLASSASPRPSQACACSAAFAIAAKPCCSSICRATVWTWTSDIMGALPVDVAAVHRSHPAGFGQRLSRASRSAHGPMRQGSPLLPADCPFTTPIGRFRDLPDRDLFALEIVRHLDVDFESRYFVAAIEPHDDLGRIQRDMPGDDGENLFAQHAEQIGLAAQAAFMRKQDLQ